MLGNRTQTTLLLLTAFAGLALAGTDPNLPKLNGFSQVDAEETAGCLAALDDGLKQQLGHSRFNE